MAGSELCKQQESIVIFVSQRNQTKTVWFGLRGFTVRLAIDPIGNS